MKKRLSGKAACMLAIVISAGAFMPADAQSVEIKGSDRYDTAVKISREKGKSGNVILVNGKTYVDALSSSALAKVTDSSVLPVKKDFIPKEVSQEIDRINPERVFIIGGKKSIGTGIEDSLKKKYTVERISGADRYDTSEKVAEKVAEYKDITKIAIASNRFDIVSAASFCKDEMPIILIPENAQEIKFLKDHSQTEVTVIGGEKSVSDRIYRMAGAKERIAGKDRYATSVNLSKKGNRKNVFLTSGKDIIDALAAGPLASERDGDIILVPDSGLNEKDAEYINKKYENIYYIGGVSRKTESQKNTGNGSSEKDTVKNDSRTYRESERFRYFDSINHYNRNIIKTADEIETMNKNNISKSPYLNDISKMGNSFAVINRRTVMKSSPDSSNNPSLALTAQFPWDPVVILKHNDTKNWVYVASVDYKGWVPAASITPVSREYIEGFEKKPFVTCISRQVNLGGNYPVDMGTRLPLVKEEAGSYTVSIPVGGNRLTTKEVKVSKDDFTKGYMPFTEANVIMQALKFEGEVYGWGHINNARDCSGFIRDLYRSFGYIVARNSKAQAEDITGRTVSFNGVKGQAQREEKLKSLRQGNTLYMKGHVFMYLGKDKNGRPLIIHQFGRYYKNGKMVDVFRNAVMDAGIRLDSDTTYLESVMSAKDFYN